MKQFQIFRYLKRWLPLIVCFFIGMTLLASRVLAKKQTYTASAVIEYANGDAKEGRAPDGSAIDVSEIASAGNMAKVMENLGLSPASYSLDTLCASIRVEPIIEEQAQNVQQALNEEGKEYTEQPTAYIVSCKLDASGSAGFARDILSELLDVYFSDYSNKHINQEQVSNQTRDLIRTDYDYLEMVEQIDAQLTETVNTLHNRYQREQGFRSADTGYSFSELRDQFKLVLDVDVPRLYALILGSRVTKDRTVLLDKYQNRIAGYGLDGRSAQEDIGDIQRIIETYVEKMRQSGNTDIDIGNFESRHVLDRRLHLLLNLLRRILDTVSVIQVQYQGYRHDPVQDVHLHTLRERLHAKLAYKLSRRIPCHRRDALHLSRRKSCNDRYHLVRDLHLSKILFCLYRIRISLFFAHI